MPLSPRRVPVQPLDAHRFFLGECARWDGHRLSVVDILAGDLWTGVGTSPLERRLHLDLPLGAAVPARHGGTILAAGDGIALLDRDGALDWWTRPIAGLEPVRRFNDAAVDPSGRLWFGSMDHDGTPGNGALHRLTPDRAAVTMIDGLGCPNGPAFSLDGSSMYLSDSTRRVVSRYPVREGGGLEEPSIFIEVGNLGVPDGLTVDAEDHLWVAFWGGSAIGRFSPAGVLVDLLGVPARQPTSVCVADDLLIVTSARGGLADPNPLDGAVLIVDFPVSGPAPTLFDPL